MSTGGNTVPRVFIVYSWESDEHSKKVCDLSDRLNEYGIDANIDQYESLHSEGIHQWMTKQIEQADYIIVVCTETCCRRLKGEEVPEKGHGLAWEGRLIYNKIYLSKGRNNNVICVCFNEDDLKHIPLTLADCHRYLVKTGATNDDFDKLCLCITQQPRAQKPPLGKLPCRVDTRDHRTESLVWIVHTPWAKDRALCRDKLDLIEQPTCIEEFLPPDMEDSAARTKIDFLGQWALSHVWHMNGQKLRTHYLLAQHLGMVHTVIKDRECLSVLKKAADMKLIYGRHGHFHDGALAIALAANYMASWFTREPGTGDVLIQWLLDIVYELSGQKATYCEEKVDKGKSGCEHSVMQLLGLLLLWWEGSDRSRAAWEGKTLQIDPTALSRQKRLRILYNLRTYDRLIQELGIAARKGTVMEPLSIRWIYKADLTGCMASVLEFLDEDRIGVYYSHLDRVDDEAKINIMRSIVRLINRLENIESSCVGAYAPVILACSRHATPADLKAVKEQRELLKKCLKLLSVPTGTNLNEHQLTFLIDLYSCGQSRRKDEQQRSLAGRCLSANGNLTVVWTRLCDPELRAAWAKEIDAHSMDPLELQSLIQHMEMTEAGLPSVRHALDSLKKRFNERALP